MKKLKVAIVGAGYVSAHHLRALDGIDAAEVIAVIDVDLARARKVANQFGIPQTFASLSEMPLGTADVVHILTPPDSHCSLTIQALEAGCHVFVEKPMAETAQDCVRMLDVSQRVGRVLSVNHSARMDPVILQAAEIARSGECGDIVGVDFVRSSDYPGYRGGPFLPAHYRTGAYPFHDLGVHGISIIETFLGPSLSAEADFWHQGQDFNLVFDEWRALVRCERGVGQMYLSWNRRPISSEVFVYGTQGTIHIDCFLQICNVAKTVPGPKFLSNVAGRLRSSFNSIWKVPLNVARFATGKLSGAPGIHIAISKFYDAIATGTPAPIPPEEGRRIMAVVQGITENANAAAELLRAERLRPLNPTSILVTGAAGFLGKRLVQRLLGEGKQVRVLVRRPLQEWANDPRVQIVEGDLGDPAIIDHAVQGANVVLHVGAAMKGSAADFERGTVWGTRNLTESCIKHGVSRLVHVSSLSVLDHARHVRGELVTEDSALEPKPQLRGFYTQTKLEAEDIVRKGAERGLSAIILRPGQIFGHGAEHVPPPGVIAFGSHWVVVGNGQRLLPLVYVEDVVDAILLAAKTDIVSGIYNIVDAQPVNQCEYIAAVTTRAGMSVHPHYVPEWLLLTMGWACELLESVLKRALPLSRYRVRSIRPLHPFQLDAASRDLKWSPAIGSKAALLALARGEDMCPQLAANAAK
jgi:predicted dehydrogenase/nucleoside-diphosphate-sugar epimerase